MNRRAARQRGFSLLELLAALAMMAVLAGSLYATLHIAFRARRSALAAIEPPRNAGIALELLRADIESSLVPRGVLAGPFLGEEGTGSAGGSSDLLSMYCAAPASTSVDQTGDVRLVKLFCEPAEHGPGMILIRRVLANPLTSIDDNASTEVLCRGLSLFSLRYFDGWDWQDDWDSVVQNDSLPVAVEVTIKLLPQSQSSSKAGAYLTSQVILLPCGVSASELSRQGQ